MEASGDLVAGRTFVVTGGASGLGEATARAFHKAGANVVLVDLNLEVALLFLYHIISFFKYNYKYKYMWSQEGQKLSAELNGKRPRSAIFCQADITSEEAVLQVIADAKKAFQRTAVPPQHSWNNFLLACLAKKKKKLIRNPQSCTVRSTARAWGRASARSRRGVRTTWGSSRR
jgi:NAD(P)-dependent dehydrogenase (short-subunit alcohol dehydrogenase family)